jgi:hypothetical protein
MYMSLVAVSLSLVTNPMTEIARQIPKFRVCSEGPVSADSVEKQCAASAESGDLNGA